MRFSLILLMVFYSVPVCANMFDYSRVDFFNENTVSAAAEKDMESITQNRNDWTEPIIGPAGDVSYYTPPEEVLNFINDPGPETGAQYMQWNLKRIDRLLKAQSVLKALVAAPQGTAVKQERPFRKPGLIVFLLKGCPFCTAQRQILDELLKQGMDFDLAVYAKGYSPDEINGLPSYIKPDEGASNYLDIHTFPATVFVGKGQKHIVNGLVDKATIKRFVEKGGEL